MPLVKKLIFAPFVLIAAFLAIYFYQSILNQYLDVYFKSYGGLFEIGSLVLAIVHISVIFCLYVTFTQSFKYAAILAFVAALIPFIFLSLNLALIIAVLVFLSLILGYFNLQTNLKTYINFQPKTLLNGPIKTLNTLILLSLTVGYFLHTNSIIQTQGFKVPEPLVDWAINTTLQQQGIQVKGEKYYVAQAITQEQINLLKANPQILEQYGVNPSDLDSIVITPETAKNNALKSSMPVQPTLGIKDLLKSQVSASLDQTIKPYLFAIPILLALIFYGTASLIMWVISIFLPLIIIALFWIFEKIGFVKYEKEMREVKKIVI